MTEVSYSRNALPSKAAQGSYFYLLIDEQENFLTQESYVHYAYKILTAEGLQSMSDLSFDFDPAYQKLLLHGIMIYRGDSVINKLPRQFKTIQREESMDRFLYDGTLTTVINLTDIRVGDVIEYEFTRKGYNPVLKDKIDWRSDITYNIDYDKSFRRILMGDKGYEIKYFNTTEVPVMKSSERYTEYSWTAVRGRSKEYEDNTPGWIDPAASVQVSSFRDWNSVAKWAVDLFDVPESEVQALMKDVGVTFNERAPEGYALRVTRFVQNGFR